MRGKTVGNRKKTLAENTADRLVEMIIGEQFDKNERLPSEFELAALLDVGRGTIREAIKILASRHVVEIRRGHGTYIADKPGQIEDPLGLAFVDNKKKLALDLFELRLIVEPRIAGLAAERVTKKEIVEIDRACTDVESSINKGTSYADEDIRLHELIAKATKNQVVENIIPIIHSAVEIFVELRDEELMRSTLVSHRSIVDAIVAQDAEKAKTEMQNHLERNRIAIDRFINGV